MTTTVVIAPLGELLRRYRHLALLTQRDLADRAGVSVRQLQNLEAGRSTRPHRFTVRRLADALSLANDDRDRLERASRWIGDDASYAGDVTTEPVGYARPGALATPPSVTSSTVAWLEPVNPDEGDGSTLRFNVCQAWPGEVVTEDGDLRWHVAVLARDVDPVSGAQLVDGLRALRRLRRSYEISERRQR